MMAGPRLTISIGSPVSAPMRTRNRRPRSWTVKFSGRDVRRDDDPGVIGADPWVAGALPRRRRHPDACPTRPTRLRQPGPPP